MDKRPEEHRLPLASPAPLPAPIQEGPGQEGPHPEGRPAPSPAEAALPKKKRAREAPLRAGGKKYRRHAKPPYSFLALIALVIQRSPAKRLRLAEIIEEIGRLFAFEENYVGWKESIRHNLSSNACFFQEPKDPTNPKSKGNFWRVNVAQIPPGALKLQNTPLSRQPGGALAPDLAPFVLGGHPYTPQPSLPSAHRGAEQPPTQPQAFTIEALMRRSPKADPENPLPNARRPPGAASLPQRPWPDPPRAVAPTLPLWPPPPPPPPNPLGCQPPPLVPWEQPPPPSFHGALHPWLGHTSCPFLSTCPLVLPGIQAAPTTFSPATCLPPACCMTPEAVPVTLLPPGCPAAPLSHWQAGPTLWVPASCPWPPSSPYPAVPGGHPS